MGVKTAAFTRGDLSGPARAVARRTRGRKAMARQKSDNRMVPKGRARGRPCLAPLHFACKPAYMHSFARIRSLRRRGNAVPTRSRKAGGGKAVTVKEEARQPSLFPDAAEKPARAGVVGASARHRRRAGAFAAHCRRCSPTSCSTSWTGNSHGAGIASCDTPTTRTFTFAANTCGSACLRKPLIDVSLRSASGRTVRA